jgi:large subunit ribosomal protein L7/L12
MADDVKKEVDEVVEEVKEAAEEVKEAATAVTEGEIEVAVEKADIAVEKAEDAADKAGEVKEEVIKEEPKVEKTIEKPEPSGKFKELIKQIEALTAIELADLVKTLEDRFGVSAAAPVATIAAGPAAAGAVDDEEKANYNVMLKDGGSNKIAAIKAVREILPDLGLVEAKTLIESAPKAIKENVPTEEAKVMKEKLEAAGAVIELV